jgi:hypothetical protein
VTKSYELSSTEFADFAAGKAVPNAEKIERRARCNAKKSNCPAVVNESSKPDLDSEQTDAKESVQNDLIPLDSSHIKGCTVTTTMKPNSRGEFFSKGNLGKINGAFINSLTLDTFYTRL